MHSPPPATSFGFPQLLHFLALMAPKTKEDSDIDKAEKKTNMKICIKRSESSCLFKQNGVQDSHSSTESAGGPKVFPQDQDYEHSKKTSSSSSSSHLSCGQPVKWDVTLKRTQELLREMGVAMLSTKSFRKVPKSRHDAESQPTPQVTHVDPKCPPKAPKANSHSLKMLEDELCTPTPSPQGVADSCVFFRKNPQENPHGYDHFSKLSDEIILSIFKWLPKKTLILCAQVCKRWRMLTYDESLWKQLDLGRKHLQPGVLGTVLARGVVHLRLAMSEVKPPLFSTNPRLTSDGCIKLQYLDLSMATIPICSLEQLLHTCRRLKKLSLEQCKVNDKICRQIAYNKDLDTLNMTMCSGLTAHGVRTIGQECQKLVSWNLSWVHLTSEGVLQAIQTVSPLLKRFNLSGCRNTLTDEHVRILVVRCPRLVELDISDSPLITGDTILNISAHSTNLERLCISRCYGITPAFYLNLRELPVLHHVEVFGIPTAVLQALRINLPHLIINKNIFSTIARPTVGLHRTSIWGTKMH